MGEYRISNIDCPSPKFQVLRGTLSFLRYPVFGIRCSIFALAGLCLCVSDSSVTISLDFSSRPLWRYAATMSVSGTVEAGGRRESYEGRLTGILTGARNDSSAVRLDVRLDSARITSTFLDEAAAAALQRQIAQATAAIAIDNGDIMLRDLPQAPVSVDWDWDIYRNLAKVLPAFPQGPVNRGATWERERTVPLPTRHGDAMGHLFQTFTLDSVVRRDGSTRAFVGWSFTYKVELVNPDTAGLIDNLSGGGKGRGSACFDVTGRCLRWTEVHFEVAGTPATPVTAWNEMIRLELLDERTAR